VRPLYSELIAIVDIACWGVCFWWMHRISSRQNAVLKQLHEQGRRIERVSREEHEILREVHPKVEKIEKNLDQVAEDKTTVVRQKQLR
jgi:iron-sulfur cluster repair protein YtfE (RIC family)